MTEPLTIKIDRALMHAIYTGPAAQLIAEGLIPEGFTWPKGSAKAAWSANGLQCWIRRTRPPGFEGPRAGWANSDFWELHQSGWDDWRGLAKRRIELKMQEIEREVFRLSPGFELQCRMAERAQADAAFRMFMAAAARPIAEERPLGRELT